MASKRSHTGEVVHEDTGSSRDPKDVEELFGGDVHAYGKWLIESCQAVSSWHNTASRMKEYQEFLCENGKEYREDVMRSNSELFLGRKPGGDTHDIFLAEQEMRARTIGGTIPGGSTGSPKSDIRKETILGLGEHRGVSVLRKFQHAPVPWDDVLDSEGKRLNSRHRNHNSLNNKLGQDGYGVCQLLDPVMEKVLFSSTKQDHLIAILQSLQAFYVPKSRMVSLDEPWSPSASAAGAFMDWRGILAQRGAMARFIPRALVSWIDHFIQENVITLPKDGQIRFLKTLLHMYESETQMSLSTRKPSMVGRGRGDKRYRKQRWGKRKERITEDQWDIKTIPIILDVRVETFYTFIKKEYGLSVHIVDKDPSRDVAVVSFEVTHRYILAIFLDIRPVPFHRTQHRLCTYLLDYLGGLVSQEKEQVESLDGYTLALDRVLKHTLRDCSRSAAGREGDSGRLMRDMLERRSGVEDRTSGGKKEQSQRKKRILATRTTGIIDVALYPCSCRRM